jgi:hypothetical protein
VAVEPPAEQPAGLELPAGRPAGSGPAAAKPDPEKTAVATPDDQPINGFHTKQITWPGGIPAELDAQPESTDASAANATAGRNGSGVHRRPEPGRTRNGLIKRQARARTVAPRPTAPPRQPDRETAPHDRTPAEVSSMLAAFRSGHQRGEAIPGSPQPPDNGQTSAEGSR